MAILLVTRNLDRPSPDARSTRRTQRCVLQRPKRWTARGVSRSGERTSMLPAVLAPATTDATGGRVVDMAPSEYHTQLCQCGRALRAVSPVMLPCDVLPHAANVARHSVPCAARLRAVSSCLTPRSGVPLCVMATVSAGEGFPGRFLDCPAQPAIDTFSRRYPDAQSDERINESKHTAQVPAVNRRHGHRPLSDRYRRGPSPRRNAGRQRRQEGRDRVGQWRHVLAALRR